MHALRSTDYPLPSAYNRAFDASSRLVFEDDPKEAKKETSQLMKAGQYPKGDALKNHVDPRTYAYLRRFFALGKVPEDKFKNYRPWFIDMILESPPPQYYDLGVENFLTQRALRNSKPISGLESPSEHNAVFTALDDRQSETLLLLLFVRAGQETGGGDSMMNAWRHGDAETLQRQLSETYREFPSFGYRLLGARNHNWIPKIESFLRSGQTHFVVVGAGHFGGPDGLLDLLKSRGWQIQQL
jgi:uncharacterized protein YbaP (TraB family)